MPHFYHQIYEIDSGVNQPTIKNNISIQSKWKMSQLWYLIAEITHLKIDEEFVDNEIGNDLWGDLCIENGKSLEVAHWWRSILR